MISVHGKHGIHKICNSEVQKRSANIDIVDSNSCDKIKCYEFKHKNDGFTR
jgi:hypothetical protein